MPFFLGFYFGVLSMIALYNFHWYRVTGEKSYLYYAFFKVAMISQMLQLTHMIASNKFSIILNANIMFLLIFLFSKEFLGLKNNFKKVNRVINYTMIFVLLSFICSTITQNYTVFDQPYSLMLLPFVVLGYFVYQRGFEPAKYYVAAWGISLALIGVSDLNKFGLVYFYPDIPFTLIGHLIESIILTYAIFVKTSLILKEKEQQSEILIHQAKLASMGQMLENISHQWRQPLNRIALFIINMKMHINEQYKEEKYLTDTLDQSQLQLEYMSETINDFCDFNKQAKDKEYFLASSAVESAYAIVDKTLEKNSIAFKVNANNDFSIYSYRNELAQVLLNLIQNAQDVLVKRQIENPAINIIINENEISVRDNAGGIEDEILSQIFEPYVTSKNKDSSLGLGLYISRTILEKYFEARIEVKQLETYTTFSIIF